MKTLYALDAEGNLISLEILKTVQDKYIVLEDNNKSVTTLPVYVSEVDTGVVPLTEEEKEKGEGTEKIIEPRFFSSKEKCVEHFEKKIGERIQGLQEVIDKLKEGIA